MKHRYLYYMWGGHQFGDKPVRGWPLVLAWVEEKPEETGNDAHNRLDSIVGCQTPPQYMLCFSIGEDNPGGRILSPEKLLARREKDLERKVSKFPLFPDYIRDDELQKHPDKYNIEACVSAQNKRREIIENANITPEWFESQMQGSDEWRSHDWEAIRMRTIREMKREIQKRLSEKAKEMS